MSIGRTTQISLAVILVGAAMPSSLALSARAAQRSNGVAPVVRPTTAASSAARSKSTSNLAQHSSCDAPPISPLSYHWPVKPFNRQHPIRGYFGDPRTPNSRLGHSKKTHGPYNIHNGVDIVTTTGTPVYPVVSGVASTGNDVVFVSTADGRVFSYYHVRPSIQSGQQVVAYETVLGHTVALFGHVHLTETDGAEVHNPLDPGHLEPYDDGTAPIVDEVQFIDVQGHLVDPLRLTGIVTIAANAHDMPALPIVGDWPGLGVAPALVEAKLRASDGSAVTPLTVTDFRQRKPLNRDFWNVYVIGTHQNKYGNNYPQRVDVAGLYSFNLTRSGLDTSTLPNGDYVLAIQVADTCGNSGSLSERITIAN